MQKSSLRHFVKYKTKIINTEQGKINRRDLKKLNKTRENTFSSFFHPGNKPINARKSRKINS